MNGVCVCVYVHVYTGVGSSLVGLGCSGLIATMGDMCPEV